MKKYRVNVNGTEYEVAVELIGEGEVKAAPAVVPAPAPKAAAPAGGEKVLSPMPGTILSIKVKDGDTVSKGQVLFVLEAMKMENEICAACDGKVAGLAVKEGESVQSRQQLCVIA